MNEIAFEGGCFCEAVRYRVEAEPFNPTNCHCADCRRASGAPFVSWVSFPSAGFTFTRGRPRSFRYAGRVRTFCGRCGTPLTFQADDSPDELDVTIGSLDHPEALAPRDHIWASDRLPWIALADDLPSYETRRTAGPPAGLPPSGASG
jgi:hypothetical protein